MLDLRLLQPGVPGSGGHYVLSVSEMRETGDGFVSGFVFSNLTQKVAARIAADMV